MNTADGSQAWNRSDASRALSKASLANFQALEDVYPERTHARTFRASSTVFTHNGGQAVLLHETVAFPADVHHVDVLKIGPIRLIVPKGKRWDDLFQSGPRVSDDFMAARKQMQAEERDLL